MKDSSNRILLADSGATTHMGPSDDGMFDCKPGNGSIKVGNGELCEVVKVGKKRIKILQANGDTQ